MAEEGAETEPWGESPVPGSPEYLEGIRQRLDSRPLPTVATNYNLEEVYFWNLPHMPAGSVLELMASCPGSELAEGAVALMVLSTEGDGEGMWVTVSVLGADRDELKKALQAYFKGGRRVVHLCRLGASAKCLVEKEDALHVKEFRWHPPGDFRAPWINSYALKKIKDGLKLAVAEKQSDSAAKGTRGVPKPPGESETERRLSALRGHGPRVSFAPRPLGIDVPPGADGNRASRPDGPPRRADSHAAAAEPHPALQDKVKTEAIDLTVRSLTPARDKCRARRKESGLVAAAEAHQKALIKREKKRSSERSRSRGRKKKSKKRRRSSSSATSSRSRSSSSDSSLLPPLRRRSQRQPGSVFRMLEQQAFDFLAQDGVLEDRETSESTHQRPKLFTYYQLGIKPGLDPKSRDAKELGLLCRALDMLKEGKLDSLSDLLSARLMAVETATKQGWATARHLELFDGEEEGSAPPHILLAAQKHGKQVERAGGKGSWPRSTGWPSSWSTDSQGRGKGKDQKGKGKKGKGRGKGGKPWQTWGGSDREKKDAKPPAEGGT